LGKKQSTLGNSPNNLWLECHTQSAKGFALHKVLSSSRRLRLNYFSQLFSNYARAFFSEYTILYNFSFVAMNKQVFISTFRELFIKLGIFCHAEAHSITSRDLLSR